MSCAAQSGSSFHDPIPPNTSARLAVFHAISAAIAIRIFYPDILRYRPEDFSQNGKYGQNLHTGFEKPIFRYRTTLVEKSRCCFRNGVFPMENRDSDIPNTLCSIVAFRDRTANLGRNKMFRRFDKSKEPSFPSC